MNYNPANPVLFREADPRFDHSQHERLDLFAPVLVCDDIVRFQVQAASSSGMFVEVIDMEDGSQLAIATPISDNLLSPGYWNFILPMTQFCGKRIKFRYFEPGNYFDSETYVVKEDCATPTLLITYWNDTVLGGGNAYPDLVYQNGFRPSIRVFGSLDAGFGNFNQTVSTTSSGLSYVCRADYAEGFRLTTGPHMDWVHGKLRTIFLHQHITVQKYGESTSIELVPNGQYNQEQQSAEYANLFSGSGRLLQKEHGLLTSV